MLMGFWADVCVAASAAVVEVAGAADEAHRVEMLLQQFQVMLCFPPVGRMLFAVVAHVSTVDVACRCRLCSLMV